VIEEYRGSREGREGPRRFAKNSHSGGWGFTRRRRPARNPFKVFLLQFFAPFAPFASNRGAFGFLGAIGQTQVHAKGAKAAKVREEQLKTCATLPDLFVSEKRRQLAPTLQIISTPKIQHDIDSCLYDDMIMWL
jgi:hypothetical protein